MKWSREYIHVGGTLKVYGRRTEVVRMSEFHISWLIYEMLPFSNTPEMTEVVDSSRAKEDAKAKK